MVQHPSPAPAELGFGHLFDQMRDAVVVSDARGRIIAWNPSAEKMFGHAAADVIGLDVQLIVPERLRARHADGMRRFHETGHGPIMDSGAILELPAVRKDGVEITIELRLSRLELGGSPHFVLALARDITDRVRLAAAVDADRARLRDANDALEAFSYVVGHDLKEPVRAVDAYLEMLSEHVVTEEGQKDLERARDANARLSTLLGGLLEWSRAAIGDVDLMPLNVDEVLAGPACRSRYQRALEQTHASLSVEGDFKPVLATEALLCQVFGNLILNAIRHNPRPDPAVRIIARPVDDGFLPIIVRDNGPGFPAAIRQRFNDRMRRRAPGVRGGFGLVIATRAVETMDGRVEIAEAPGGGGEARVWLRVAK